MDKNRALKSVLASFLLVLWGIFLLPTGASAAPAEEEAPTVALTAEELAYRDRAGEITIGCPVNDCPLLFQQEDGQLAGIAIDILDLVARNTGLTFRYAPLPSGQITYEDLERLQVDMVAGVERNAFNQQARGIVITDTYLHAAKVFVCKEGTQFRPEEAMTIAVSSGSQTLEKVIRQQYPRFQVLFCNSIEEALNALDQGKADAVLQNQYAIERILRKPIYEDLRIVATASIGDSQCLASLVPIGQDGENLISEDTALLLSIVNKGIETLDQSQVSFLIIRETAENAYQFTLADALYHYRFALAGLGVSLVLILVLLGKNRALHRKRAEQLAAQQRAQELAAINARMQEQQVLLEDALERAEAGNRAKTAFLFNMSHDIRTPMNAILGFTEIAQRNLGNAARLTDCLKKIQTSGKQLLRLLNNVLDMTKLERGTITLSEDGCNLREGIEKAQAVLQTEIDQKSLTVQIDTAGVEDEWVCCDSFRLHQILFNVLSNAVKFSKPRGEIQVTLRQQPCAMAEYAAYEIRVKDYGVGMSPEFLDHMFEPFERERTSTMSQTQGTGLGLAITKNLVDLMGGTVQVTSRPGEWTEVVLGFPFRRQARKQPKEPAPAAADTAGKDFSGRRLLLVDDNELNMEIARELLLEAGFQVETAENGQIAVDMVQKAGAGYYDAVLMDIQMPVMDGYQAARAIRALEDKALAEIPILALTANAFEEDKKEALANGMNAHIAKPLDVGVLYETLEEVLGDG